MMGPSKWERHTGSKKKKWKESIKLKTSKKTLLSWVKIRSLGTFQCIHGCHVPLTIFIFLAA